MIILMIDVKSLLVLAVVTIILISCARIFSKGAGRGDKLMLTPYASGTSLAHCWLT